MSNHKKSMGELMSFEELVRKCATCRARAKEFYALFIAVSVSLLVAFGAFACSCSDQIEENYTKKCDVGGGNSIWQKNDAKGNKGLLLRSPIVSDDYSNIFGNGKKYKDESLLPSKSSRAFYFYPNGKRFIVVKGKDGLYCFPYDDGSKGSLCGFEEVGDPFITSNLLECGNSYSGYLILQIGDVLIWGKTKQLTIKVNGRVKKIPVKITGPNQIFVFHNTDSSYRPYAEVIDLKLVDGEPVYIGRIVTKYEPGTPEVEVSEYHFIWGDTSLPINCEELSRSPVRHKKGDRFVELVKPFTANICARKLKIGLDSKTSLSSENGKSVKKRDLYFSVKGERYPATEYKKK